MIKKRIQIDGIDKTGKDLILKYVVHLSNHKYVIQARGIITQIAYSKIYGRDYEYDLEPYKNDVIFLIVANEEDLKIRHKITNEPKIDINRDAEVFLEVTRELNDKGLYITTFNSSLSTPYQIAKKIIEIIDEEEIECLI